MRMSDIQRKEALSLYLEKHWSCNMIAKELGFSRAGIKKFLNRVDIDTTSRRIKLSCINCGKELERVSCRVRQSKHSFCNKICYFDWLRRQTYNPWRHGQRIARQGSAETLCRRTDNGSLYREKL